MLCSIYTPMAASTGFVITGYIKCPSWTHLTILYSMHIPKVVSTCLGNLYNWEFFKCPPTVAYSILYISLRLFQPVLLYNVSGYIQCPPWTHFTILYSMHNPKVVSTSLVITGYIQCPPTLTYSILYISLRLFQHVWLYLGIFNVLPGPTLPYSILCISLRLSQHVWLYLVISMSSDSNILYSIYTPMGG